MLTVVILTFDRREEVLANVAAVLGQAAADTEVIVVDNGPEDATELFENRFGRRVRYLHTGHNLGCGGRNVGIQAARGDIIVMLDDDVFLKGADVLAWVERFFVERPDASAVNFKVVFEDDGAIIPFNWYHPRDWRQYGDIEFETDYISEGAVAFRRSIFEKAGLYPDHFFISHEGPDLAYRIIDQGGKILYWPGVSVVHKVARAARASWRNSYYDTRNQIWLGVRNLPLRMLLPHLMYRGLTTFLFSLVRGHMKWYFKAIRDGLAGLPREWRDRKPVRPETVRRLRNIRRLKPGPVLKIRQFAEKMQLVQVHYK